jgi:hypothetical protein
MPTAKAFAHCREREDLRFNLNAASALVNSFCTSQMDYVGSGRKTSGLLFHAHRLTWRTHLSGHLAEQPA